VRISLDSLLCCCWSYDGTFNFYYFSLIVSEESACTALLVAALNGWDVMLADIQNAPVHGLEFGSDERSIMIKVHAFNAC
jgi:hypothetical protein